MADTIHDALVARVRLNLPAFAGVGVTIPDPQTAAPQANFWGWADCPIETAFVEDPANPTFLLCAKPPASWSPGLDALVIDHPIWFYIDTAASLDATATAQLRRMAGWPAGATFDVGDIPPNGALRAVGTLNLAAWSELQSVAAALGLDPNQPVSASIDFPAGFPRVRVWAARDRIGGLITNATVGLSSILGPTTRRFALQVSGTLSLGSEGDLLIAADVPLDGDTILARGTLTPKPTSTLHDILPLYTSGTALSAEVELSAAAGTLAIQRVTLDGRIEGVDLVPGFITVDADARITILDPTGSRLAIATVDGRATFGKSKTGAVALDVRGSYPAGEFQLSLAPDTPFDVASFLRVFVGDEVYLPALTITTASVNYYAPAQYLRAEVRATTGWDLGPVHITSVGFTIQGVAAAHVVSFDTEAMLGPIAVSINAVYDQGWSLAAVATTAATIDKLLHAVPGLPDTAVPDFLKTIDVDRLGVTFKDGKATFSCDLTVDHVDVAIELDAAQSGSSWALTSATLRLGGQRFTYVTSPGGAGLVATYQPETAGAALNLAQIAAALHIPTPDLLSPVLNAIAITSAQLVINKSGEESVFTVAGTAASTAAHVSGVTIAFATFTKADKTTASVAAAGLDLTLGLADLPIVGSMIGSAENLGVSHIDIIAGSPAAPTKAHLDKLHAAYVPGSRVPTYPAEDLPSTLALSVLLKLGPNTTPPIVVGVPDSSKVQGSIASSATADAPSSDTSGSWLTINKSLGPINIRRIGLRFADAHLWLMLDAGFMIAGVDLELDGLMLGFTPTLPPVPDKPALRGIDVSFDGGAVTLGGGLLAVKRGSGATAFTEYDGQLILKGAGFQLTALASYAPGDRGASLFGFVVLDEPLGGPPFFYVTGVAAGFGFNRTLNIPPIDQVPQFPLVKAISGDSPFASKTDPGAALTVMQSAIPVDYGENWVALGVHFTTFKLFDSTALAFARFGADLEIGLIGRSTVTVPANATTNPIAYAELALSASFKPNDGVLSICGQLTPASYVLSPDCHLTGGFAYMAWFKSTGGATEGDFVVTLGGYHPAFKRPPWYPVVPRVGAVWQVNPNLLIKSTLYFALTPSTVMAGGSLEATWHSGDLKAWFTLDADFLLCWKPFYYEAEVAISLGASYRVNLWITSFTVSVTVGVDLRFWGPPFAGTATVDLYVVSFTIRFGDSKAAPAPIEWDDFKKSFLPKTSTSEPAPPLRAMLGAAPIPPRLSDPYCLVRVTGGLVKDFSAVPDSDVDWVINPERFAIVTSSVIPITDATLKLGTDAPAAIPGKDTIWDSKTFGVGPVGVPDGKLVSSHAIVLSRTDGNLPASAFQFAPPAPVLQNVPSATWSQHVAMTPGLDHANDPAQTLELLTGFVLTPSVRSHDPLWIDLGVLQFSAAPVERTFAWSAPKPAGDLPQIGAAGTFTATLTGAKDARKAILKNLALQGLAVSVSVDVSALAERGADVLLHTPFLAPLGTDARKVKP